MKRLIYICIIFLTVNSAVAGNLAKIPETVKNYLKSHFPAAKSVHWEKHGDSYIAHFVNANAEMAVCLSDKGELLDRVTEISNYEEIPAPIKSKLDVNHLVYAEKYEGREGDIFYMFEVKLSKTKVEEFVFDKNGKQIKEIVINDNGDASILEF